MYRLYLDDCLRLPSYESETLFDLIYIDPCPEMPLAEVLKPRLEVLADRLHDSGFLLLHLDCERAHSAKPTMDELGLQFKGDLIWAFRQRAVKTRALQNQHSTILVYSNNPFYYPKRVVFAQSVVGPSSSERVGYPGQKPVELLKRILHHFSDYHGIHLILDPLMGSGTTCVAGLELGKTVVGFDTSPFACRITEKRMEQALPATLQLQLDIGD